MSNRYVMRSLVASLPPVAAALSPAMAATIELHPGQSFEQAAEALNPGDTLVVHAGTYIDSGRIAITVKGTQSAPVVIQGAAGEARPRIRAPSHHQNFHQRRAVRFSPAFGNSRATKVSGRSATSSSWYQPSAPARVRNSSNEAATRPHPGGSWHT